MALKEVTVINHHALAYKDKHHGVEFVFKPNEKVLVPLAAGVHFFGVGLQKGDPARVKAWQRRGYTDAEEGEAFLRKFECDIVEMVPEGSNVAAVKEEHLKTVEEMKAYFDKQLSDLEADHRDELQRISEAHAEEIKQLKAKIVELETPAAGKPKK